MRLCIARSANAFRLLLLFGLSAFIVTVLPAMQAQEEKAAEKAAVQRARQDAAAKAEASPSSAAKSDEPKKPEDEKPADPMSTGTFSGLRLRSLGPAFTSGRVNTFAVEPNNPSRYYVATASGGVWKTVNAGITWTPVFDREGSYSIGAIALDPKNPQVAARLMGAFRSWRALETQRRGRAEATLRRVAATAALSRDVTDIVARTLAAS